MSDAIRRDLAGRIDGEILFDDLDRILYSTDASHFEIRPVGVIAPANAKAVADVVAYCRARQLPVIARGAGTGVCGQALGEGIVLDFRRHMNRIVEIDGETARVQPGVVLKQLNDAVADRGLMFAPDPSSGRACTIGGMIANNASGIHGVRYGATRDYVESITCVLDAPDRAGEIHREAERIWQAHARAILSHRPEAVKNSSGYLIYNPLRGGEFDIGRLLIGSEGTLGIFTEAQLKLVPRPPKRVFVKIGFADIDAACRAVLDLRERAPSALELLDGTVLDLMRGSEYAGLVPREAGALLVCEFEEPPPRPAEATSFEIADESIWRARRVISPLLERWEGVERSTRVIEDVAVRPDRMPDYVRALRGCFARHDVRGAIFGHAGSGHLHVNLLMDPHDPRTPERMDAIAGEIADVTLALRGTLSGEHGDGLLRTPYLRKMFGPLYDAFVELKRAFDPRNLFNPGKIVAAGDVRAPFRRSRGAERFGAALERCNGCGFCLDYCPLYAEDPREASLPRALANARVAGVGVQEPFASRCPSCNRCVAECPAGFDPNRIL